MNAFPITCSWVAAQAHSPHWSLQSREPAKAPGKPAGQTASCVEQVVPDTSAVRVHVSQDLVRLVFPPTHDTADFLLLAVSKC